MPLIRVQIIGMQEVINEFKRMEDKGKSILNEVALDGANFAEPKIKNALPYDSEEEKHIRDKVKVRLNRRTSKVKSSAVVEIGSSAKDYNYAFHLETGHKIKTADGKIIEVPPDKSIRTTFDRISKKVADRMHDSFVERTGGG